MRHFTVDETEPLRLVMLSTLTSAVLCLSIHYMFSGIMSDSRIQKLLSAILHIGEEFSD